MSLDDLCEVWVEVLVHLDNLETESGRESGKIKATKTFFLIQTFFSNDSFVFNIFGTSKSSPIPKYSVKVVDWLQQSLKSMKFLFGYDSVFHNKKNILWIPGTI